MLTHNVLCPRAADFIRPGGVGVLTPQILPHANLEAWQRHLNRWTVRGRLPIALTVDKNGTTVALTFKMLTVDKKAERAGLIEFKRNPLMLEVTMSVPTVEPDDTADEWIRAIMRWMYCHELDEWIIVDRKRMFDPHRDGRTPTPENS